MLVIPAQARLHGCRAFGELSGSAELTEDRAMVERRREQAAEESSCFDFAFWPATALNDSKGFVMNCHNPAIPPAPIHASPAIAENIDPA